jgi:thiol:disulfide interchange protein
MRHRASGWIFLGIVMLCSAPAVAADIQARNVTISVSLESAATQNSTVWVAVRQTIRAGWHTYWQNPGMAGLPLTIDWQLPEGVTAGEIRWPVPERFEAGGVVGYGYRDQAIFLAPLMIGNLPALARNAANMKLSWLVCAEMCIPEEAVIHLDLNQPRHDPDLFAKARASLPQVFPGTVSATYDERTLKLSMRSSALPDARPDRLQFFPGAAGLIDDAVKPEFRVAGNELIVTASRPTRPAAISKISGIVISANRAFTIEADAKPAFRTVSARPPQESRYTSLFAAALFALLGGFILNLMPCVLPVLSMKALALARIGGQPARLRRDSLFYFAGVMVAFCALASVLLLLKGSGAALGWGFQLQSPVMVFWLAMLMLAIGCNLLGIFELPTAIAGIGADLTKGDGDRGAFYTGILAALVASPCTAPFMGTAIAYVLLQPGITAFAVMAALAAGFALPVLLMGFVPGFARLIPKPGAWTVWFRESLAFPMFGSAIWLIWVLDRQTGPSGLVIALSLAVGAVFLIWLVRLLPAQARMVAGFGGFAALLALSSTIQDAQEDSTGPNWQKWSPGAIETAQSEGNPALVDFTADWCVTCLVNERIALENDRVTARLASARVRMLKADWTKQDTAITAELARHGRSGVPLYLLYPAGQSSRPIVLPQILTPAAVMQALDRAERKATR